MHMPLAMSSSDMEGLKDKATMRPPWERMHMHVVVIIILLIQSLLCPSPPRPRKKGKKSTIEIKPFYAHKPPTRPNRPGGQNCFWLKTRAGEHPYLIGVARSVRILRYTALACGKSKSELALARSYWLSIFWK